MKIHKKPAVYTCLIILLTLSYGCRKTEITIEPDAFVSGFLQEINADTLRTYVQWLQDYDSRFFLKDNRRQIATDIKNKFIRFGYSDVSLDSFYLSAEWNNQTYQTWQYNVIARLEGHSSSEAIYVVGAHYDSMNEEDDPFILAPGANDNASGVAGILEIARVLKKHAFVPANTIEFVAFASEEYDLNGSADYARKAAETNASIVLMLNHDMISYEPDSDQNNWTVNVMDYPDSKDLRTLYVSCGQTYTSLNFIRNNQYTEDGDSYSFFQEGYGSLFILNEAEESFYHTSNDVIGHCNFPYCKEVVSVSCALLVQENK